MKRLIFLKIITLFLIISHSEIIAFSKPNINNDKQSNKSTQQITTYFKIKKTNTPLKVTLKLINQLPENPQKNNLTIQTFRKHLTPSSLSELNDYLNQIEKKNPKLFRQVLSHMAVEMEQKKFTKKEILNFIKRTGSINDQNYAIEEWIIYLIHSNQTASAEKEIELLNNLLMKNRLYQKLIIHQLTTTKAENINILLQKIQSKHNKNNIYYEIAIIYAQQNQHKSAVNYIAKIQPIKLKEKAKRDISNELGKNLAFDKAVKLLNTITDPLYYTEGLTQLSINYANNQKYESAYQLISSIETKYHKDQALAHLGKTLLTINDVNQAKKLLNKINTEPFYSNLVEDITLYFAQKKQNEAAINFAYNIKEPSKQDALILKIATQFSQQENYHYQLLLINKLEPKPLKVNASNIFIETYIVTHPLNRSFALIKDLPNEKQTEFITKLAIHYIKNNNMKALISLINKLKPNKLKIQTITTAILNSPFTSITTGEAKQLIEKLNALTKKETPINTIILNSTLAKLYSHTNDEEMVKYFFKKINNKQSTLKNKSTQNLITTELIKIATKWKYYEIAYTNIAKLTTPTDKIIQLNQLPHSEKTSSKINTKNKIKALKLIN